MGPWSQPHSLLHPLLPTLPSRVVLAHVQKDVAQARQIQERWGKRAQVADALDAVIDDISELATLTQPVPLSPLQSLKTPSGRNGSDRPRALRSECPHHCF